MLKLIDKRLWLVTTPAGAICMIEALDHRVLDEIFGQYVTEVWVNLALAIVAAFIFYIFVDVFRRWHDARAIAPYVTLQIRTMLGDVEAVCREAATEGGMPFGSDWSFNSADVAAVFKLVGPNSIVKSLILANGQPATFLDLLNDRVVRTDQAIMNLVTLAPYIGAEGMAVVTLVQNSTYLLTIKGILRHQKMGIANKDLSVFSDIITAHWQSISAIQRWAKSSSFWKQ